MSRRTIESVPDWTILLALEDTVSEMQDEDPYYESIRDASEAGPHTAADGPVEVQYDEMTRIVIEPVGDAEGDSEQDSPAHTTDR